MSDFLSREEASKLSRLIEQFSEEYPKELVTAAFHSDECQRDCLRTEWYLRGLPTLSGCDFQKQLIVLCEYNEKRIQDPIPLTQLAPSLVMQVGIEDPLAKAACLPKDKTDVGLRDRNVSVAKLESSYFQRKPTIFLPESRSRGGSKRFTEAQDVVLIQACKYKDSDLSNEDIFARLSEKELQGRKRNSLRERHRTICDFNRDKFEEAIAEQQEKEEQAVATNPASGQPFVWCNTAATDEKKRKRSEEHPAVELYQVNPQKKKQKGVPSQDTGATEFRRGSRNLFTVDDSSTDEPNFVVVTQDDGNNEGHNILPGMPTGGTTGAHDAIEIVEWQDIPGMTGGTGAHDAIEVDD